MTVAQISTTELFCVHTCNDENLLMWAKFEKLDITISLRKKNIKQEWYRHLLVFLYQQVKGPL